MDALAILPAPRTLRGTFVPRSGFSQARVLLLMLGLAASSAQAAAVEIYRCPGNPAVYTSDLRLVQANRCTKLGTAPAVVRNAQALVPVSASPAARTAAAAPQTAASPAGNAVTRQVQQQRDSDRVQILQAELARERERLTQLTQQWQLMRSAEPDAASAARPETLALSQAIQRSETDVQALDKELARALR
jgi:hypothetical protein